MKRFALILVLAYIGCATIVGVSEARLSEKMQTFGRFPWKYPPWLAYILEPFGVADAQAAIGFQILDKDKCEGANLLQRAAKQHQLFAEANLLGYYHFTGMSERDPERIKKSLLWWLHYVTHFPNEPDESRAFADMLKLTPDQENDVRERFKTWKPEDDPPVEPASCPGQSFEF